MTKVVQKRDAKASKSEIIKNATLLFSKKDYVSSSMEELASMSGLNKAMIFYYFKNKQGLHEAVMEKVLDDIYMVIQKENKNCKKPIEELESFIKTYATFACKNPHLPRLLLKELGDSGSKIPEKLFYNMKKLFSLFSNILIRGEEKGCFKDAIPMILYFMIIGTLNLMVATKSLRVKALEIDGIDTCAKCDIDEISEYLIKKIKKMLKDT